MFQYKRFGYSYLALASLSVYCGLFLYFSTFKTFALSDALRSILIDLLIASPALFLGSFGLWYIIPCVIIMGISCTLNVMHISSYSSILSPFAMQAMIETTPPEAFEFLLEQASITKALFCLGCWIVPLWALKKAIFAPKVMRTTRLSAALFLVLLTGAGVIGYQAYEQGFRLLSSHHGYMTYWSINRYYAEKDKILEAYSNFDPASIGEVSVSDAPDTLIIIVGESANRNHLGLYGYHRDTTPSLSAMRDELAVFTDVISPATHTVPSLKRALRFSDIPREEGAYIPSIIDVLNSSGYKTFWLSNQPVVQSMTNVLEMMTSHCDVRKFRNMSRTAGKSCTFDGQLLPWLKDALSDKAPRKAIFLHQLGSHLSYSLRYPADFDHFTDGSDIEERPWFTDSTRKHINEYDNSLRYTDWFVSAVIGEAKKTGGDNLVLFFSDHGQDVYDTRDIRGCSEAFPTRHMVEVPFIIWTSKAFNEKRPDRAARIRERTSMPYSTKTLSTTISQLAGISFEGFPDKTGLFADDYIPKRNRSASNHSYEDML